MKLRVAEAEMVADGTRSLRLVDVDGALLPAYKPGSHLRIRLERPEGSLAREYSLVRPADAECRNYEIAVLLEPAGNGGSIAMHALLPGDVVDVDGPFSEFELSEHATEHVLVAGGIGITPIFCMAQDLARRGQTFELHYASRTTASMAYRSEIGGLARAATYVSEGKAENRMPLQSLLAKTSPNRHLYVCGPKSLISGVLDAAQHAGWHSAQVHFESFKGAVARATDRPIQVTLRASNRVLEIPGDRSILEVMLESGIEPLYDCKRGECGLCVVPVVEGNPEHRDQALSDQERREGKSMCICVSRALTPALVLDC